MRRAARRDATEPAIVDALERIGALVQPVSGADYPDLVVGFRGQIWWLECKSKGGKLKPGQERFHQRWAGFRVATVYNAEQAIKLVTEAV